MPHFPFKQWLSPLQPARVEALLKIAAERQDIVSFAGGLPADDLLPTRALAETLRRVMAEHACEALQYQWSEGYEPLRAQIVGLLREREISVGDGELLITHGAQQALDLLARLFLRTGDPLAIESPTYVAAIDVFRLQRPRMCALVRDDAGLDLEQVRRVLAERRPNLFYVAPTGHNPIGNALSAETCTELIALAHEHAAFIVEDDAYGSIQFDGPRPPLRAYSGAAERVIHVGTFSKMLTPGLRVGWIVAPRPMIDQLLLLKGAADLQTSSLSQIALSMYLDEHDLRAHVRRALVGYRERRDAMLAAMAEHFSQDLRWTRPTSGFSIWVTLPGDRDAEALLPAAIERGVAFEPGAAFFPDTRRNNHLRLSFSNQTPEAIAQGISRLAEVLDVREGRAA